MQRKKERKKERTKECKKERQNSAIRASQPPISPIGFLFLKLPPPPCAVLLVM